MFNYIDKCSAIMNMFYDQTWNNITAKYDSYNKSISASQ